MPSSHCRATMSQVMAWATTWRARAPTAVEAERADQLQDCPLLASPVGAAEPHSRPLRGRTLVHGPQQQVDPLVLRVEAAQPEHQSFAAAVPVDVAGNVDAVGCDDHVAS